MMNDDERPRVQVEGEVDAAENTGGVGGACGWNVGGKEPPGGINIVGGIGFRGSPIGKGVGR